MMPDNRDVLLPGIDVKQGACGVTYSSTRLTAMIPAGQRLAWNLPQLPAGERAELLNPPTATKTMLAAQGLPA